ncbi:uncharacterized protein A1O5_01089 [Cladophialophora psammophila CBS 110553]|uniref:Uncharacterized protein n=1 Tax=Cladophialophora psammophila CBS 110553 TaxID=1182543 RepID=W9XHZ9_9EURO|nr:uncharacterized protein A1O5_01089 [Cladophialophora psammophila CBS 110553]EXJ76581.1 hypothetical protein A1O5_01089 [Cladophialophora psammophila CBS 110553]
MTPLIVCSETLSVPIRPVRDIIVVYRKAARPNNAAPATPNPAGMTAAALVVEDAVADAEETAELRPEDAAEVTEPAWLVTALKALAASAVMLPRMEEAAEVKDERVAAAPVLPVAASELRLERLAENADLAEVKLAAMEFSAFSAELEAEAATEAAELETEARDLDNSDEMDANELETAEGVTGEELDVTVELTPFP